MARGGKEVAKMEMVKRADEENMEWRIEKQN
jgi:hypothetical protein